jgi:hypothetical protein
VIDRARLVQKIKRQIPPEFVFANNQIPDQWNIGILVCGCLTACAAKPNFKNLARKWIVVAGHSVDLENAPEEKLAAIVTSKLNDKSCL